jgi:tetratricopeptide (TPR) repeat protein
VLSQIQPATSDPALVLLLGRAYARARRLGEAQKMLRTMTELSVKKPYPRLRSLQNALQAEVSLAERKTAVAVEAAEKADQFSDTTSALETLGRCYEAAARNDEAIRADSEAGPTFHRVVELHYHLGTLYQKTGQTDLAKTQIETFLKAWSEADANLEMRKDAEQRLHNAAQIRSLAGGNPTPAT